MTLNEILGILGNYISTLEESKKRAAALGELERVVQINNQILTTQDSIDSIKRSQSQI